MPIGTIQIKSPTKRYSFAIRDEYNSYEEYLESDQWEDVKQRFIESELNEHACSICGISEEKAKLYLHHKTYKRIGCECLEDLMLLCKPCHDKLHGY